MSKTQKHYVREKKPISKGYDSTYTWRLQQSISAAGGVCWLQEMGVGKWAVRLTGIESV